MTMFFFKPKKIVVDIFTALPGVYEFSKPRLASTWLPKWWKNLPNEAPMPGLPVRQSTMKRCIGVTELYKRGFVLPLWSDLVLEVSPIGTTDFRWFSPNEGFIEFGHHPEIQRSGYLPDTHYQQLKINNMWAARSKEDVYFLMSQPTWNHPAPEKMLVCPGLLNFKFTSSLNINVFIPREKDVKTLRFNAGFPLAHVIPLSERDVDLRVQLVDHQEMKRLTAIPSVYMRLWKTSKQVRSGCPIQGGA